MQDSSYISLIHSSPQLFNNRYILHGCLVDIAIVAGHLFVFLLSFKRQ